MTIAVRQLAERDGADWRRLFLAYIEFYQANVPEEVIALTWQRMLAGEPNFHVGLVAVDENDRAVGFAHVLFHRSTWSSTWYCYLEDLYVDPAVRGRGIGRALIEAVYQEADARGATRTYWMTHEFNYRARTLYDKVAVRSDFIRYQRREAR
ncbi:MAG TPA: GNAT family N-acetyltransferase [Hyphomicrobiaceae bacterium]|nr:GNAT family N-acetyltransferase [Hyphomicrobiaceae bacterium]